MEKFNLANYEPEIRAMASYHNVTPAQGLSMFLTNLNAINDINMGCPDLNFRDLGQQWSDLRSDEKVAQRAKMTEVLSATTTPRSATYRAKRED